MELCEVPAVSITAKSGLSVVITAKAQSLEAAGRQPLIMVNTHKNTDSHCSVWHISYTSETTHCTKKRLPSISIGSTLQVCLCLPEVNIIKDLSCVLTVSCRCVSWMWKWILKTIIWFLFQIPSRKNTPCFSTAHSCYDNLCNFFFFSDVRSNLEHWQEKFWYEKQI